MDEQLKQRLVGAAVLVILAVVLVPAVLRHDAREPVSLDVSQPLELAGSFQSRIHPLPSQPTQRFSENEGFSENEASTPALAGQEQSSARGEAGTAQRSAVGLGGSPEGSAAASSGAAGRNRTESPLLESGERSRSDSPAPPSSSALSSWTPKVAKDGGQSTARITAASAKPVTEAYAGTLSPRATQGLTTTVEAPDQWAVQLASFSNHSNALALMDQLKSRGYPAYMKPGAKSKLTRVLVGPQRDRGEAKTTLRKLAEEVKLKGFLVRHES